ncbi:MAG: tRNA (adenosine(37)-N6)-dimethylallyltransferase MiaA [Hyphomicrobium sp.]
MKTILIAGPTASGKSALAMALAEHIGGRIVNADSMQVYCELSVLTARPSPDDERRVPHALYGFVPASEPYSVGRFTRDAAVAIAEARSEGQVPIIVGGTGLYFKTLLEGLSPVPAIPEDVRRHWRTEAVRLGPDQLHAELAVRDPLMASRLRPSDPQRVVRALEVIEGTGRSLGEWQRLPGIPVVGEADTVRYVLQVEGEELQHRADLRFDAMLRAGALGEVRTLAALDLDPELPAMRALGVRPLMRHLAGESDLAEAAAAAKAETWQYIRRQRTWLRRNMMTWKAISSQQTERMRDQALAFIDI